MTEEVAETPAAAEVPASPAAPAESAPAQPVAAPQGEAAPASLIEAGDPNVEPAEPAGEAPAAETPAEEPTWLLAENVPGEGEAPEWFKADKYGSMEEQAKAYVDLEKRFGAFTGAPKDGVYAVNPPEGVALEFDTEHELFQELNSWANESQLSQKAYDDIIGMFGRYEASLVPDMNQLKTQVGENADARISSVAQWAKSNLSEPEYKAFRDAQTQPNAAEVFKAFEAIISKTRAPAMPKPGDDVTGATPTTLEEIDAMQAKRNDEGQRLYEVDEKYRAEVEKRRLAYFKSQEGRAA